MLKILTTTALACAALTLTTTAPAEARVCHNTHGKAFNCHKLLAPRVNLKAHHPVKVERCRGQNGGRLNNCK